jgi:hypothetical protein
MEKSFWSELQQLESDCSSENDSNFIARGKRVKFLFSPNYTNSFRYKVVDFFYISEVSYQIYQLFTIYCINLGADWFWSISYA